VQRAQQGAGRQGARELVVSAGALRVGYDKDLLNLKSIFSSFLLFFTLLPHHRRVDVPRGGSAKHADPYWFAPDGWRFRSG
jgi:hypothetical protein